MIATAAAAAALALAPARFPPRAAWRTGHTGVHACPGVTPTRCVQATTWAATVRWRDCAECLPHATVAALPRDGIALQVGVAVEHPSRLAGGQWPPRIRLRDVGAGFEGLPGRIGVYQHTARVRGVEVSVMVFFGRDRPSARQRAAAEAELRAADVR
jgi:hypothetical protein